MSSRELRVSLSDENDPPDDANLEFYPGRLRRFSGIFDIPQAVAEAQELGAAGAAGNAAGDAQERGAAGINRLEYNPQAVAEAQQQAAAAEAEAAGNVAGDAEEIGGAGVNRADLSAEDVEAIARLTALGIDESMAIAAYIICDHDETLVEEFLWEVVLDPDIRLV